MVVAYDPRALAAVTDDSFDPEQTEQRYHCRQCGTDFSIVERPPQ